MLPVMSQTPARLAQRKKQRFLEALMRTGNVTTACGMAALPRETAYYWRSRDPDFGAMWDEALERGLDALEDEVMRRAKDGIEEPVYYRGAVVGETRRYSDTLAMFILKSKRREVWGERQQIDLKYDWTQLSEAERLRKAAQMLDIAEELVNRPLVIEATPIRYDPTDGDELADEERRRKRLEDLGQDDPGGIGR